MHLRAHAHAHAHAMHTRTRVTRGQMTRGQMTREQMTREQMIHPQALHTQPCVLLPTRVAAGATSSCARNEVALAIPLVISEMTARFETMQRTGPHALQAPVNHRSICGGGLKAMPPPLPVWVVHLWPVMHEDGLRWQAVVVRPHKVDDDARLRARSGGGCGS